MEYVKIIIPNGISWGELSHLVKEIKGSLTIIGNNLSIRLKDHEYIRFITFKADDNGIIATKNWKNFQYKDDADKIKQRSDYYEIEFSCAVIKYRIMEVMKKYDIEEYTGLYPMFDFNRPDREDEFDELEDIFTYHTLNDEYIEQDKDSIIRNELIDYMKNNGLAWENVLLNWSHVSYLTLDEDNLVGNKCMFTNDICQKAEINKSVIVALIVTNKTEYTDDNENKFIRIETYIDRTEDSTALRYLLYRYSRYLKHKQVIPGKIDNPSLWFRYFNTDDHCTMANIEKFNDCMKIFKSNRIESRYLEEWKPLYDFMNENTYVKDVFYQFLDLAYGYDNEIIKSYKFKRSGNKLFCIETIEEHISNETNYDLYNFRIESNDTDTLKLEEFSIGSVKFILTGSETVLNRIAIFINKCIDNCKLPEDTYVIE